MSTPEVIDYIQKQIAAGADPESVRDRLIQRGWRKGDVDKALAKAGFPLSKPKKTQEKKAGKTGPAAVGCDSEARPGADDRAKGARHRRNRDRNRRTV